MRVPELHGWALTPTEACDLQTRLAAQVRIEPLPREPKLIAGADVAFERALDRVFAAVLVLTYPELELVEQATAHESKPFPYVPGLLSFREGPAVLRAFAKLQQTPDVVIFDGQGIAHPRRLGLASHMGLWLRLPTVGCAKSRLIGQHDEPGVKKGDATPLLDDCHQIGVVLRTRAGVKPVFVSPGHLSDFETAQHLVIGCCRRFRLPEPTRQAHAAVAKFKKAFALRR